MSKSRLEIKVGLFVFCGLVLLGVLLLQFSKGLTFFRGTYQLQMHASDVGGLKERAQILMSGVQVGTVSKIQLAPDGKSVTIYLKIYDKYTIHNDAEFAIEASGFLGDQYVAIKPTKNLGDPLTNNAPVTCEQPLNIQEVARDVAGFIRRVDETARKLDAAISDIRRLAVNEQNLTNLSATVSAMRAASERALDTVDQFNTLLVTNAPLLSSAASNVLAFSKDLTGFSGSLNDLLETNREAVAVAVKNIEDSSDTLKTILEEAKAGKGLAGTLLHNEAVASQAAAIVNNLSITTSNLNRLGLYRVLFPKPPRPTNAPPAGALQSPKAGAR